jgi:hypothetical protein
LICFRVDNFELDEFVGLRSGSSEYVPGGHWYVFLTKNSTNLMINIVENPWPENENILLGLIEIEVNIMLKLGERGMFEESDGFELDFELRFLVNCLI